MKVLISFEVQYAQIAVFASSLLQPFNDWSDRHVAQGFAWRPGSVSFRSVAEEGRHSVEIEVTDDVGPVDPESLRVVDVPFDVPDDGSIEVGSVSNTVSLSLPAGAYQLRCEFMRPVGASDERVRLTFAKSDAAHFAVLRADADLSICAELLTTAEPASS